MCHMGFIGTLLMAYFVYVILLYGQQMMVGTEGNPQYMCRSCFDKYKTLMKLCTKLLNKAEKALAKMTTVSYNPSAGKRVCTAPQQPPSKQLFLEEEEGSPAEVVSH